MFGRVSTFNGYGLIANDSKEIIAIAEAKHFHDGITSEVPEQQFSLQSACENEN